MFEIGELVTGLFRDEKCIDRVQGYAADLPLAALESVVVVVRRPAQVIR